MNTFILSTPKALSNLETFYRREQASDVFLTLDNLVSSSSLLGFCSFAHKTGQYRKLLEKSLVGPVKFALIASDLALELKLCETEWSRVRETIQKCSGYRKEVTGGADPCRS